VAKRASEELNDQEQRFVDEYLVGFNATQAAIRAGYSPKSAAAQASRLLTKVKIASAIAAKRSEIGARLELNAENLMRELARVVFFDPAKLFNEKGHLLDPSMLDPDTRAALGTIKQTDEGWDYKAHPKVPAIELAMRYLGMLKQSEGLGQVDLTVFVGYEPARIGSRKLQEALPAAGGTD